MKRVSIAQLKDHLSQNLLAVERGAIVEVMDRSRPIARIVPVDRQRPRVQLIPARRPFASLRGKRYRRARWKVRSLELLLEERRRDASPQ